MWWASCTQCRFHCTNVHLQGGSRRGGRGSGAPTAAPRGGGQAGKRLRCRRRRVRQQQHATPRMHPASLVGHIHEIRVARVVSQREALGVSGLAGPVPLAARQWLLPVLRGIGGPRCCWVGRAKLVRARHRLLLLLQLAARGGGSLPSGGGGSRLVLAPTFTVGRRCTPPADAACQDEQQRCPRCPCAHLVARARQGCAMSRGRPVRAACCSQKRGLALDGAATAPSVKWARVQSATLCSSLQLCRYTDDAGSGFLHNETNAHIWRGSPEPGVASRRQAC